MRVVFEGSLKGAVLSSHHPIYCLTRILLIMKVAAMNNFTSTVLDINEYCPKQTG